MMFGDDKKLLLPIVFDLANLVKNSARKYIKLDNELTKAAVQQATLQERKDELTVEESAQDDNVGTIDVSGAKPHEEAAATSLEDFFDEVQSDILDPQMINEALQSNNTPAAAAGSSKTTPGQSSSPHKRTRRSPIEFVHKLTRSVPLSVSEQQLLGGAAGRTIKLNTTAFQQPNGANLQSTISQATITTTTNTNTNTEATPSSTQTYEEIEDLAFAGLNGTELPLSADARTYELNGNSNSSAEEPLPSPEELIAGPRYRLSGNKRYSQKMPPIKRKRVQSSSSYGRGRPKTSASSHNPVVAPPHKKCERFTNNMCIRTDDYPL